MSGLLAPRWLVCAGLVAVLSLSGCNDGTAADYPDPTAGYLGEIRVAAITPQDGARVSEASVGLLVTLTGAEPTTSVAVADATGRPVAFTRTATGEFAGAVTVLHGGGLGRGTVEVVARRSDGQVARRRHALVLDVEAPAIAITEPAEGARVSSAGLWIRGVATSHAATRVLRVELSTSTGTSVVTPDATGRFAGWVVVSEGSASAVDVTAIDELGRATSVSHAVVVDAEAPTLAITEPAPGTRVGSRGTSIVVRGTVDDADGALDVVRVGLAGTALEVAELTSDGRFVHEVMLGDGHNVIVAEATDTAGLSHRASVAVHGPELLTLRLPDVDEPRRSLALSVDREGLEALIPPDRRSDIRLFDLDLGELVSEALDAIAEPDVYGLDVSTWSLAARNLQRVLVMTPETADLSGTQLADVMAVTGALGIPESQVLATLLQRAQDESILERDLIAWVLEANLVATHPSVTVDAATQRPLLPVTMADGLSDMATLGARLGPMGDHPGILDGEPHSQVMTEAFRMTIDASSNLHLRDGIDLGVGKSYLFEQQGDAALDFDFASPDRYTLEGIADAPRLDMRFRLSETDQRYLPASIDTREERPDGPFFKGGNLGWTAPATSFEAIVLRAAYRSFRGLYPNADPPYASQLVYSVGDIAAAATIDWDRGWLNIDTDEVVDTPPAAYIWDTLLEVAQLRLHDGGIAEGEADIVIPLTGLHVPLTASEIVEATRTVLATQETLLSDILVGARADYDTVTDVFVGRSPGGSPVLRRVTPLVAPAKSDLPQALSFFADPELQDTLGDELLLSSALEAYCADGSGGVWLLRGVELRQDAFVVDVIPVVEP